MFTNVTARAIAKAKLLKKKKQHFKQAYRVVDPLATIYVCKYVYFYRMQYILMQTYVYD